ncbi:50S ribosomal protein L22 [Candidatus Parcubacteria bacterium]|nr:50S ribosomal protein L22 [Candidatus Parcubacteria bacterium]
MMSVKASARGVRMSPRKVGVVAALVRGRTVADAVTILQHTPRRSAQPVRKLIESARANAENNNNMLPDTLVLSHISVTPGTRIKRFRPVARGMAHPYQLRSSHIFVEVTGEKRAQKPAKPSTANKPAGEKKS